MSFVFAKPVGMTEDGEYLLVRSSLSPERFKPNGSHHGYRYEWNVNHFTFSKDKEETMSGFGLTEDQYEYWDGLFLNRYDKETEEWYQEKEPMLLSELVSAKMMLL
jgi:hypothetical protein